MDKIDSTEVQTMTNEQFQIFIEAIQIIAEKSETKEEFLKELERLKRKKKPQ